MTGIHGYRLALAASSGLASAADSLEDRGNPWILMACCYCWPTLRTQAWVPIWTASQGLPSGGVYDRFRSLMASAVKLRHQPVRRQAARAG